MCLDGTFASINQLSGRNDILIFKNTKYSIFKYLLVAYTRTRYTVGFTIIVFSNECVGVGVAYGFQHRSFLPAYLLGLTHYCIVLVDSRNLKKINI